MRELFETASAVASETTTKPIRRSAKSLRRWLAAAIAGLILAGAAAYQFRHIPFVRTGVLALLASCHSIYDTSQVEPDVTGPASDSHVAPNGSKFAVQFEIFSSRREILWPTATGSYRILIDHPSEDIGQGTGSEQAMQSDRITYSISFQAENPDSQALKPFVRDAEPILDAAADEFQLCDQVRRLARHGVDLSDSELMQPDDVLRAVLSKKRVTCRPFALLLVELSSIKGYTARMLGLSAGGSQFEHAVVEVFLPERGKWIVLDPDFNIAYRRGERWLSAAELHDAWMRLKQMIAQEFGSDDESRLQSWVAMHKQDVAKVAGIEVVPLGTAGKSLRDKNLSGSLTGIGLNWYEHVYYGLRNDYLTSRYPVGHPMRNQQYLLQANPADPVPPVCPEATVLTDRRKVYWPVGRTSIKPLAVDATEPDRILLRLSTFLPDFKCFEVTRDDGQVEQITTSSYEFALSDEVPTRTFRAVNHANVRYEPTTVTIARTTAASE